MTPMVTVRCMTAADAPSVAALSGQLGYPSTADQIARRFAALDATPDSAIFVAVAGDRIAGWAHVVGRHLVESDPFAELMGLVVDGGSRRRGAGRALVDAAERWASERGYASLHVRSNMARTEARPFYEQMGYAITKNQYVFVKKLA